MIKIDRSVPTSRHLKLRRRNEVEDLEVVFDVARDIEYLKVYAGELLSMDLVLRIERFCSFGNEEIKSNEDVKKLLDGDVLCFFD